MTKRISPFQFDDHREFLRIAIKERGFSYRSFAAKNSDVISFISIALTLSKGRSGTKNKPTRNFSPETLARLGKVLKLSDDEIIFLILLKFENDSAVLPGVFGSAYVDAIRKILREERTRRNSFGSKPSSTKNSYSETANTIALVIDALPARSKLRLSKEILTESKGVLARQSRKAGVRHMTSAITRLDELVELGAP